MKTEDASSVFGYRSDPEISRYQGWIPKTINEVEEAITKSSDKSKDSSNTWKMIGIEKRDDLRFIGDLAIKGSGPNFEQVEIGISISPEYQNQGYAKESVSTMVSYLFDSARVHRIYASVDPRNENSIRLFEGLGFRKEGHMKKSFWLRGEWVDDVIYAMLEDEHTKRPTSSGRE